MRPWRSCAGSWGCLRSTTAPTTGCASIHYGHWEGRLWLDLPQTDPEGHAARAADPWNWQPVGGESYRRLSERVAGWLAEMTNDAVVVSHGGVSKVLRGLVLQLGATEIASLEVPQDKVLRVTAGSVGWV